MDHPQSVVSGIFVSANGDSSYHGLTSTLFDGAPVGRHGSAQLANRAGPVEPIQQQLMGEAAYQSESLCLSPLQKPIVDSNIAMTKGSWKH